MKRLIFLISFSCFLLPLIHAQSLGVAPTTTNPIVKAYATKELLENPAVAGHLTGSSHLRDSNRDADDCEPEFNLGSNLVEAGDSLVIDLASDTFGLGQGPEPGILSLLNIQPLLFGAAQLDTSVLLTYKANPALTGNGSDTMYIEFSQPNFKDTIQVVVFAKRKGRVVVANAFTMDAETKTTYCLDDELDFPYPKSCSEFLPCSQGYDGNGAQLFYFTNYNYADTCFTYLASRFPGVDTVCVKICDEWTVCDTFKVPFIVRGDTLSIGNGPIFDDFSGYPGPYPTNEIWLDKAVFKNNTLAKNPPSVGLVTFDGLDFRGDPYNISNGVGDRLTSKPIDLSGFDGNSQVSLRFYIAPKGYGLQPEVADSIFLEFRNNQRKWIRVRAWPGTGNIDLDSFPPFTFYGEKIADAQFFHKAFQFRFSAKTSPANMGDLWHLDYLYLDKGVAENVQNFSDLAFSSVQADLLKNYTSMPFNQFEGFEGIELNSAFKAMVYNHFADQSSFNDSRVSYLETTTNTDLGVGYTIAETGANFPPLVFTPREADIPGGQLSILQGNLANVDFTEPRNVQTQFAFENTTQGSIFRVNDTLRVNTRFSNYFAHDDGTAEWQLFIRHGAQGGQKQTMAVKFHANTTDSLKAVQIMFPHVNGDIESQFFDLNIWIGSLDTDPVYARELLKPFFANNVFDTLQGFTTYRLETGNNEKEDTFLVIPANTDFYVGFRQASAAVDGIPIGFDLQHPCGCNYSNVSGEFKPFPPTLPGALMIRPVFANVKNTSTGVTAQPAQDREVGIYPNPTSGRIYFRPADGDFSVYKVFVFNDLGQMVKQGQMESEWLLDGLAPGMYYFQIQNSTTGTQSTHRIVLQPSR
ncbi:MAG: T9SS type A sorting domain-containing protein [Saprospiraceae bacterium]